MAGVILPNAAPEQPRQLIVPRRPDNVRGRFGAYVTHDMFHIAERIKEEVPYGDTLTIQVLDPPVTQLGTTYNFAITEYDAASNCDRLVMRVVELDSRVITRLQRMIKVPFEHRFAEMEKQEAKWAAEEKERQLNELYENLGGQMRIDLAKCNFTDPWGSSYRPMNRTARRARQFKKGGSRG